MNDMVFDLDRSEELVSRARDMRPLLLATAAESEALGELVPDVVAALIQSELLNMAVPQRWKGLCAPARTMARVAAELARGCTSTAWVVTIMNTTVWRVTLMSDGAQEDLLGERIPRFCGVAVPPGKARQVDGGYVIENGRWPYASGSHHAEMFHGPIAIEGIKGPAPLAIIPMSDLKIEPSWNVAGMRASGSDTVVAENVFVPSHRVPFFAKGFEYEQETRRHTGELTDFWTPLPLMRSKALGTLVGAAEGLLDCLCDGIPDKPMLWTNYRRKGDSPVFQALIGRAGAQIHAVRTLMDSMTDTIDRIALERRPMDARERAFNRGQMAVAITMLTEAVEALMNGAGSSGFLEASPAQRFWRDYSVGARHISLLPEVGYEIYGRLLLGEPDIVRPDYV